jgi:hypothetical protein
MKERIQRIQKIFKSNPIYIYIFFYFLLLVALSFFRHASADESYYLRETMLISELLKNGKWIGNYGVGLHGFLFKLPVALIYILLGKPSVFVATLFTIILNISSLVLFYNLVKRFFKKESDATWSTILLSVLFHFLTTSITFLRDIPAVFTVLLFLFLFLKKANTWKIGFSLLLMLDAKEHIFFTVAPVFVIYTIINHFYFPNISNGWKKLKGTLLELFKGYFFSILWIILMFTTSIIPINMFVASIAGQIKGGITWHLSQFRSASATENLMGGQDIVIPTISIAGCVPKEIAETKDIPQERDTSDTKSPAICSLINILNVLIGYIGKTLYPRTFSFISIPKIIVLPSIVVAFSMLKKWLKEKDRRVVLPIVLILNVLFLILRASHGRYLLCVAPVFALFFVMFIKDGVKREKYFRSILIWTSIFVVLGLYFESTFITQKIILESSLLILLWSIWVLRGNKKLLNISKTLFFVVLVSGMFLTSFAFSYSIGQISSYMKYGSNRETLQIAGSLNEDEVLWINDYGSGELINVYRKNLEIEPEWAWPLKDSLPKQNLLKIYGKGNTYSSLITEIEDFRTFIQENSIKKVLLVESTSQSESFLDQDKLPLLLSQDWLLLVDTINLKNKTVYIFKVVTGN